MTDQEPLPVESTVLRQLPHYHKFANSEYYLRAVSIGPTARFNISVELPAGSKIAVVRHSGSDKSTLERLLCCFLICTTQTVPRCGSRAALPRMPRSHT